MIADPAQGARFGVKVVDGDVEEALDLRSVQVHGDDVVAAGRLQHVGHQTRGNGRTRLVLFVLACVGEVWQHGCDATGRSRLARVDHDEQLHDAVVDVARSGGLKNEDCAAGPCVRIRRFLSVLNLLLRGGGRGIIYHLHRVRTRLSRWRIPGSSTATP